MNSFSLDGQQNVTITGNTTIANMTNGLHSIAVYANDTFGNVGASETISFTIAKPEAFPTATVSAVSGALALWWLLVCWSTSRNASAENKFGVGV